MKRKVWSGKDIERMGFPAGRAVAMVLDTIHRHLRKQDDEIILAQLNAVLASPTSFLTHEVWSRAAQELLPVERKSSAHALRSQRMAYAIYGSQHVDESARHQMEIAMKLPVTAGGVRALRRNLPAVLGAAGLRSAGSDGT